MLTFLSMLIVIFFMGLAIGMMEDITSQMTAVLFGMVLGKSEPLVGFFGDELYQKLGMNLLLFMLIFLGLITVRSFRQKPTASQNEGE